MSVQAARTKQAIEDVWQAYKPILEDLWLRQEKSLQGDDSVMLTMENEHGFVATKSRYERHFKKWKWSKYNKKATWEHIAPQVVQRDRHGKETEVLIRGKLQMSQTVRKNIGRYWHPKAQRLLQGSTTKSGPEHICIRSPILDMEAWLMVGLPFRDFEKSLRENHPLPSHRSQAWPQWPHVPPYIDPQLVICAGANTSDGYRDESLDIQIQSPSTAGIETEIQKTPRAVMWPKAGVVTAALKSVLPKSMDDVTHSDSSLLPTRHHPSGSVPYRHMLFSVANCFAGLDEFSPKQIMEILRDETSETLHNIIRCKSGYSSRAIAQNVFKAAIEAGDTTIVDLLLTEKLANIDTNEQVCVVEGERFTPIERASMLRHKDVINVLLQHRADVNKTYYGTRGSSNYRTAGGALQSTLGRDNGGVYNRVDPEIFQALLEAGSDIDIHFVRVLISRRDGELVRMVMSTYVGKTLVEWSSAGIFLDAIRYLDRETCLHVVRAMLYIGADLNYHDEIHSNNAIAGFDDEFSPEELPNFPLRVIDAAAQSGNLEALRMLHEAGATQTEDTLHFAIESGNETLIHYLLDKGADVNGFGHRKTTPLVVAIQSKNGKLVKLLLDYGADVNCFGGPSTIPLVAAIRSKNERLVKLLLDRGAIVDVHNKKRFSAALAAASEAGNLRWMEQLIKLGGDVSPGDLGVALIGSICEGHDEFAKLLIDAGADVNSANRLSQSRSRHPDGSRYGPPLYEALKHRSAVLVRLLLDVDADFNYQLRSWFQERQSSLSLAVEWGDISIIKALIFAGVNAKSHSVLINTVKQGNQSLLDVLLGAGSTINSASDVGMTALEAAAQKGDIAMVRRLLDLGADLNDSRALSEAMKHSGSLFELLLERFSTQYSVIQPGYGSSSLKTAIRIGHETFFQMLLDHRADPNALDWAEREDWGEHEDWETPEDWEERGVWEQREDWEVPEDWQERDDWGEREDSKGRFFDNLPKFEEISQDEGPGYKETPFGYAISTQGARFVEMLLTNHCDPNSIVFEAERPIGFDEKISRFHQTTLRRKTALLAAIDTKSASVLELLIRYNADVNFPALLGIMRTPLQRAAEVGSLEVMQLLLDNGAEVNAPAAERYGGTALQFAAKQGFIPLACLLLNRKADVDAPSSKVDGRTALEGAAEHGRLDMIQVLVNHGVASNGKDKAQIERARSLAKENGHFPVCAFLEDAFRARNEYESPFLLDDEYMNWDPEE